MNKLINEFDDKFGKHLGQRRITMKWAIEYLELLNSNANNNGFSIIETGTLRTPGNWGDGQSTLIWEWAKSKFDKINSIYSIDIDLNSIEQARTVCHDTKLVRDDSLTALRLIPDVQTCGLLYLDSFDCKKHNAQESAFHHMCELALVYGKLPSGCLIMVDDCVSQTFGKHLMVRDFMERIGNEPYFTGYQSAWLKI